MLDPQAEKPGAERERRHATEVERAVGFDDQLGVANRLQEVGGNHGSAAGNVQRAGGLDDTAAGLPGQRLRGQRGGNRQMEEMVVQRDAADADRGGAGGQNIFGKA